MDRQYQLKCDKLSLTFWMERAKDQLPKSSTAKDQLPRKPITIYQVALYFGKTYSRVLAPDSMTSGFKVSGIYSFDSNILRGNEFLGAEVTEQSFVRPSQASANALPDQDLPSEHNTSMGAQPSSSDMRKPVLEDSVPGSSKY